MFSKKTTMTFGKHNGSTLGEVLDKDPEYICWLLDNTSFKMDKECLDILFKSTGYQFATDRMSNQDIINFLKDVSPDEVVSICQKAQPNLIWSYRVRCHFNKKQLEDHDKKLLKEISHRHMNWNITIEQ
jgi:Exodeoxyribonuclease X-like C-terminal